MSFSRGGFGKGALTWRDTLQLPVEARKHDPIDIEPPIFVSFFRRLPLQRTKAGGLVSTQHAVDILWPLSGTGWLLVLMIQKELVCFKASVTSSADVFASVLFWEMAAEEMFSTLKLAYLS